MSTQFATVVAETSGTRGHRPPCPAGLGANLLLHPLHRPPLGSSRRQYLPPVLVEVKLPNVSGTGQRVETHLTCRVVSRRRDLYEVGVSHVLLPSNLPADPALYRERGTLTLPLLRRSGSTNPASLARRALSPVWPRGARLSGPARASPRTWLAALSRVVIRELLRARAGGQPGVGG